MTPARPIRVLFAAVLSAACGCDGGISGVNHADASVEKDAAVNVCVSDGGGDAGAELPRPLGDLTGPWQLFVDEYLVATSSGLVRTVHPLLKHAQNPVMAATEPWEDTYVYLYGRVMPKEDGAGYHMWYASLDFNDTTTGPSRVLYATSPDGFQWTKPALGIRSWNGNAENNLFIPRERPNHICSVMHTPWDPDSDCQYKIINFDGTYETEPAGYYLACSSDGVNFTDHSQNPVINASEAGVGDVGQFLWDPWGRRYLGYVKVAGDVAGYRRRLVALMTASDPTQWPTTSLQTVLEPDEIDDRWATGAGLSLATNRTHFYGLSVFPYESLFLGFLWIFRASDPPNCGHDCEPYSGYIFGTIHVELVSSRDAYTFTREEVDETGMRPPIIELGPSGAWDSMMIFTANHPLRDGDNLRVYYGGCDENHGSIGSDGACSVGLATLRKDGFVSMDTAGAAPGTLLTPLLAGTSGFPLRLNFRTWEGGSVKVEVLDEGGDVVPGYGEADCEPMEGDSVDRTVMWGLHDRLPAPPCTLRMRFILSNASLYSFAAGGSLAVID